MEKVKLRLDSLNASGKTLPWNVAMELNADAD
jgi:hypothetical protein